MFGGSLFPTYRYSFILLGPFSSKIYSLFHKTLPKSSLLMHWISVRFYEMGDTLFQTTAGYNSAD